MGFGVGLRKEMILQYYWYNISRLDRLRRYYDNPFKGHQWVTKGDPLLRTIFNTVADAVICN